jgi:PIN domain nuclease of toxin-antitoxin system
LEILADTHALVWWMEDASRLSANAAQLIRDPENRIFISAAVAWELAIKIGIGKITPHSILDRLAETLREENFLELPITIEMSVRAGLLTPHHRDPFDRMLVAQAQSLSLPILSADAILDRYGISRIW